MTMLKMWCAGSMAVVAVLAVMLVVTAGDKAFGQRQEQPSTPEMDADSATPASGDTEDEGNVEVMTTQHTIRLAENGQVALFLSVAITVGIGCLSAGYAVAKVGAAALGAASEKPEIMGRALIFVGLAEGIAIYGLIVGIMLLRIF